MKKRRIKKIWVVIFSVLFFLIVVGIGLNFIETDNKQPQKKVKEEPKVEEKKEEKKSMSLVAVGDCLIHGAIYHEARTGADTYDFSNMISEVKPLIENYDLKYYNQETIIGGKNLGVSHYPLFNSPDEIGDNMVDLGFNMVSLANNHSLDKGEAGILYSNEYWKNKGVVSEGTYSSQESRDNIEVYEQNGVKYAFLAYTTVTNGLTAPVGKEYLLNVYSDEQAKADIDKIKDQVDVIMVAMHWGEEYIFEPNAEEKQIAQYLSSLGVNLIIGSHPHVIQPVDYINETLVIYSLGNFISGQRSMGIDKTIGLMVGMNIVVENDKVAFENIDYNLLYTYSTTSDTNYKVYPFKNLNDNILNGYQTLEQEYLNIVNAEVIYD